MIDLDYLEMMLLKLYPDMDDVGIDLLLEDVKPIMHDWVLTNLVSKLDAKAVQEFNTLLATKPQQYKIEKFFSKYIPDMDGYLVKLHVQFEQMYIEGIKQ